MKRLLIPFLALAFCPPAQADKATFGLAELPPLPSLDESENWGVRPLTSPEIAKPVDPIVEKIEAQRKRESELRQKQEVAKCKAHKKRWKQFGRYEYDWYGWKQTKGTWVTARASSQFKRDCNQEPGNIVIKNVLAIRPLPYLSSTVSTEQISVTCAGLRVSLKSKYTKGWEPWRLPSQGEETAMVAALCTEKK